MRERLYELLLGNQGTLSTADIILNFLIAGVIAAIIYLSYKISHHAALYSRKFNVSLVMLTLITTLVMNVIGNNIALSLGMVGALSIVRFRTAIKDPRDTAYIFWAIAVGICCGVSDYLIALIGSVIIFAFLLLFGVLRDGERTLIIVHTNGEMSEVRNGVENFLDKKVSLLVQNSTPETGDGEMIFECAGAELMKQEQAKGSLQELLSKTAGVKRISIVRQEDEVHQ
ncbi:MAG: DUF4956 domain-containing protein [Lachnospiraceae bacterium]|nr:DUF4956 domain-containing protein [Lachnospiraceae bacterium]